MDSDGYPDEQDLKKIREWPYNKYGRLFEFVKSIWEFAEVGYFEQSKQDDTTYSDTIYTLHTGGWSGNEDIIRAMQENIIFWTTCWVWSRQGGHYEFKLPKTIC